MIVNVIYLAGTISADEKTKKWRDYVTQDLGGSPLWLDILDPLRGKSFGSISKDGLTSDIPADTYFARDLADIREADLLLVNLNHIHTIDRPSVGTYMEMGIAAALGKPMVVVCDPEISEEHRALSLHPFVTKPAVAVVPSVEEALRLIRFLAAVAK